ncbi:MAG TPA: hypothetical protein VM840_06610, partial [Actinomycetota bacterium]|nr:hypothetical protein [Actinomycetota bacterium]
MKTAQDRETTSAGQRQSPWRGAGPALALFASAYLGLGRAFEVPALILLAEVAFLGVVAAHVVHRGPDLLTGTRYRGALFAVYLLAILVVLQAWNPNTPGLGMWAIGARKSFLPAIALVAGYVWQIDREELLRVVRVVAWLMLPVLVFGVFDFLQPTAIGMAVRAAARADRYTGEIGGVTRAVSVLPGPFHFGMLGLLGVGVALAMPERRLLRLVLGAAGVAAVVTSLTRTNLVGLVVVPVVYLVVARRAGAPKR